MSVKLFVLGVLSHKDAHGYEIRELGKEWGLEYWSSISYSSIYHALEKLKEENSIDELTLEQEGNRPTRTVYRITEKGRNQFITLLHDTCTDIIDDKNPINIALAFITELEPDKRIEFLSNRKKNLEILLAGIRQKLAFLEKTQDNYKWAIESVKLSLVQKEAELVWVEQLIKDVPNW